jgi:hypothetical protein
VDVLTRVYPERILPPYILRTVAVRRVSSAGTVRHRTQQPFLSQVLRGEDIRLEEVAMACGTSCITVRCSKNDERSLQITGTN